jgi:predicted cation transporter
MFPAFYDIAVQHDFLLVFFGIISSLDLQTVFPCIIAETNFCRHFRSAHSDQILFIAGAVGKPKGGIKNALKEVGFSLSVVAVKNIDRAGNIKF